MSVPEVQGYFRTLPYKVRREVAKIVRETADELKELERQAAPQGETGRTRESVRVSRGRHDLALLVEAGGDMTTVEVRGGSGVGFDYALAGEFGTEHQPAAPWFYPTYRDNREAIHNRMVERIGEAIANA